METQEEPCLLALFGNFFLAAIHNSRPHPTFGIPVRVGGNSFFVNHGFISKSYCYGRNAIARMLDESNLPQVPAAPNEHFENFMYLDKVIFLYGNVLLPGIVISPRNRTIRYTLHNEVTTLTVPAAHVFMTTDNDRSKILNLTMIDLDEYSLKAVCDYLPLDDVLSLRATCKDICKKISTSFRVTTQTELQMTTLNTSAASRRNTSPYFLTVEFTVLRPNLIIPSCASVVALTLIIGRDSTCWAAIFEAIGKCKNLKQLTLEGTPMRNVLRDNQFLSENIFSEYRGVMAKLSYLKSEGIYYMLPYYYLQNLTKFTLTQAWLSDQMDGDGWDSNSSALMNFLIFTRHTLKQLRIDTQDSKHRNYIIDSLKRFLNGEYKFRCLVRFWFLPNRTRVLRSQSRILKKFKNTHPQCVCNWEINNAGDRIIVL